jgi:putative transposase
MNSGYWQIPVDPADREKTTFTSHEGLYWFFRMPFGLRNAPATFKRFVDIKLGGFTSNNYLFYLDEIIDFSKTKAEHIEHLEAVLGRLCRADLSLNLEKCHFNRESVSYLGLVVYPGKIAVAANKTHALRTAKPSKSPKRSTLVFGFVQRVSPIR